MSEDKELVEMILATEAKAGLIVLLHRNPGIMSSADGIAVMLGKRGYEIESDLDDFLKLGILKKRTVGKQSIYQLDREKDKEIQSRLEHYFKSLDA